MCFHISLEGHDIYISHDMSRGTMFIPRVHSCVNFNNMLLHAPLSLLWGHGNKHPEDGLMPPSFLAGVTNEWTLVHQS